MKHQYREEFAAAQIGCAGTKSWKLAVLAARIMHSKECSEADFNFIWRMNSQRAVASSFTT